MFHITVTEDIEPNGTAPLTRDRFVASADDLDLAALAKLIFPSEDAPRRKTRSDKDVPRKGSAQP